MAQQKIRIRLKGYDHQQVDRSASQIVETAQRTVRFWQLHNRIEK